MTNKEIGCTQYPYTGHIELKECPDVYTSVSKHCGLYNHEPIEQKEVKTMFDVRLVNPRYDLCPAEKCEDCPLNHYGMTCTSHRVEYWEEQKGKKNEMP